MCDNKCKTKGYKFDQIAAVVSEDGGAAHTINFCKKCNIEMRAKQAEAEVAASKRRALIVQKGFWRKVMGRSGNGTIRAQDVGTIHHQQAWARSIWEGAAHVRRLGRRDAVQGTAQACAAQQ